MTHISISIPTLCSVTHVPLKSGKHSRRSHHDTPRRFQRVNPRANSSDVQFNTS